MTENQTAQTLDVYLCHSPREEIQCLIEESEERMVGMLRTDLMNGDIVTADFIGTNCPVQFHTEGSALYPLDADGKFIVLGEDSEEAEEKAWVFGVL